ncbi:hypothetical protein L9F63_009031, partial [Diploptera punctata]
RSLLVRISLCQPLVLELVSLLSSAIHDLQQNSRVRYDESWFHLNGRRKAHNRSDFLREDCNCRE